YAKEKYFQDVLELLRTTQYVDGLRFKYRTKPRDLYYYFRDKLEGFRFDAIAGGLQAFTEEVFLRWVNNAIKKTRMKKICIAGGVAMNVKVNMKVNEIRGVELFVNPVPSDESQAIGASMAVIHDDCVKRRQNPEKIIKPLKDAYLGPDIADAEILALIKKKKIGSKYHLMTADSRRVAKLLVEGKVVGRASGRSEFGARALGNRSIIADPRNPDIIKVINEKIKNRDFWMPFAATILEKRVHDYLIGYKKIGAPYMTVAFDTTLLARKHLKAGLHPYDNTCRPQVLKMGQNDGYEKIILEFERLTGVGGVLNTSFNLHGEPIVQTAADAFRVFELSDIDALILNGVLIEKK
ncbi:MAG: carbamoyltransferase, partial [Candidatus Taylorbacteria bacterium]|nr:carbamoyltransferase [Candidatus Taylorbacteria bacterium]